MKTYRIEFADNTGSFAVDAIAHSAEGRWYGAVSGSNGTNDMAFVEVDDAAAEYLEEMLDADDNVISYGER